MLKLLRLKLKSELEELKSIHRIEMAEAEAKIEATRTKLEKESEIKLFELASNLRLKHDQAVAKIQLEKDREIDKIRNAAASDLLDAKEKLLADSTARIKDAMTKLHEEGNVTTKFVQDIALKMFEHAPASKSEMKFIGKVKADADTAS